MYTDNNEEIENKEEETVEQQQEEVVNDNTGSEQEEEQVEQVDESSIEQSLLQATAEELDNYDSYEDYLAAQQQVQQEPSEEVTNDTTEEPSNDTTGSEVEQKTTTSEMTDAEFRQFITGKFRANHKDVQVTNPDDIRTLMQYGMNYHKKMAEIAPYRKILKALQSSGFNSEDNINFAIDLLSGNKEAIAQLIKDKQIDIYELNQERYDDNGNPIEQTYQRTNHMPSDARIAFDNVLEELSGSESGKKAIDYIRNLDGDSFAEVFNHPHIVRHIADHIENGLFEDAMSTLEQEYALGRVPPNTKAIDAYAHVAQYLEKANPNKYRQTYIQEQQSKPVKRVVGTGTSRQSTKPVNQSKYQAGIPTNNSQSVQSNDLSGVQKLLNMSDDELSQYDNWEQFLQKNNINFN